MKRAEIYGVSFRSLLPLLSGVEALLSPLLALMNSKVDCSGLLDTVFQPTPNPQLPMAKMSLPAVVSTSRTSLVLKLSPCFLLESTQEITDPAVHLSPYTRVVILLLLDMVIQGPL